MLNMLMLSSAQGFIDFLIKQNLASSILQLKTLRLLCIQGKPKWYIFAWTKKWPGRRKSYFEKLFNKFSFSLEGNKIDECEAKAIFYFDAMTKSINLWSVSWDYTNLQAASPNTFSFNI